CLTRRCGFISGDLTGGDSMSCLCESEACCGELRREKERLNASRLWQGPRGEFTMKEAKRHTLRGH
ncbi:MAG: hypothetical protein AB1631_11835, partial [Acidobacteriota bacterium]